MAPRFRIDLDESIPPRAAVTEGVSGPFRDAALDLLARGLAIVPCGGADGKVPLVEWGKWTKGTVNLVGPVEAADVTARVHAPPRGSPSPGERRRRARPVPPSSGSFPAVARRGRGRRMTRLVTALYDDLNV